MLLAALIPRVLLTGCRLDLDRGSFLALSCPDDQLTADQRESWRSWLASTTAPVGAPAGGTLVAAEIRKANGPAGFLMAVLPGRMPAEQVERLKELLALAGHTLGLRLDVEAVSTAAGELTHALNNSLNSMILQAAVLQTRVPEALRDDLGVIRKEGVRAAALLQPLASLRAQYRPGSPP
jgi:hypothetical protein